MEAKFKNALKLGLVRANKQKLRILNDCEEGKVSLRTCLRQNREQDAAKVANGIVIGGYRVEALTLVIKYMTTLSTLALSTIKSCGESDNEMKCAIQSLVFVSPSFPELTELTECRQILVTTLGKGYFTEANMRCVNPLFNAYASLPSVLTDFTIIQKYVSAFAKENRIDISAMPLFTTQQTPSLNQSINQNSTSAPPQQTKSSLSVSSPTQIQTQQQSPQKGQKEQQQEKEHPSRLKPKKTFTFFGLFDTGNSKKAKTEVDPSKCVFEKASLKEYGIAGTPTKFTIKLNDSAGAPSTNPDLQSETSKVHILVSGPEGRRIIGSYTDNKDGTLTGEFTPPVPGLYAIAVYCGGVLLGGDALMQKVKTPDEIRKTDPSKCTVDGPGLKDPMVNDFAVFTVTVVDAMGERRPGGADKISVLISGPDGEHIVGDVEDNGDGTYTASFLPVNKGKYAIAVYCENSLIGNDGKPFIVDFTKESTKFSNDDEEIIISADDEKMMGESETEKKISSGGGKAEKEEDGDEQEIDIIEVESEEDSTDPDVTTEPMLCIASGNGLKNGGVAQEMQMFTIRAINSDGKQRLRGGERFRVFISGPDDLRIRGKVHDLGNGTYTAAYVPPVEGLYNIAIYMGNTPVGEGKPIQVEVKPKGDGSGSGNKGGDNSNNNDEDDDDLMKRFKVLHDPLNNVQNKPGYLEKKKISAERLKKK